MSTHSTSSSRSDHSSISLLSRPSGCGSTIVMDPSMDLESNSDAQGSVERSESVETAESVPEVLVPRPRPPTPIPTSSITVLKS
jgi:hypothetical protein